MTHSDLPIDRSNSWRAVVEAYQVCSLRYGAALDKVGLTTSQFEVMLIIGSLGNDATPKRIADRLLVTKGNITGVTSRLLSRNLVTRHANESDGRSTMLGLTEEGRLLLKEAKAVAEEFVSQQLAPFSDIEVEIVGKLMRRMKAHLMTIDPDNVVQAALS